MAAMAALGDDNNTHRGHTIKYKLLKKPVLRGGICRTQSLLCTQVPSPTGNSDIWQATGERLLPGALPAAAICR